VAGNRDVIENDRNGWLVEHDSRAALVGAMARALGDPARLEGLGANARRFVAERFSWDAATSQLIALLPVDAPAG
jgi:glycosyltransferase involved in cell wall biosynthesis